jgi:hypothetical protein
LRPNLKDFTRIKKLSFWVTIDYVKKSSKAVNISRFYYFFNHFYNLAQENQPQLVA